MNNKYLYKNGEIFGIDSRLGLQEPREYTDNFNEILITENVIETIEKKLKLVQTKNKIHLMDSNKVFFKNILKMFSMILGIGLGASIILAIMAPFLFETITLRPIITFSSIVSAMMACSTIIPFYYIVRDYIKEKEVIKGNKKTIEFLTKELENQKSKLLELQNDKSREKEQELVNAGILTSTAKSVNYIEELKKIRTYMRFYHLIGARENEYLKYYQQGTLRDKLAGEFLEKEFDLIEKYIQENYQLSTETKGKSRTLKPKNN